MSTKEWKKYKLGELGKLARGKSKNRPRDAAFLYGGIYPFIQTGDIKSANHKIYKYSQTYSEAGLSQSKLWAEGTIAITIAANIAETGILTFPACFPDSVLGFIADKEKCDVDFIEYLLRFYKKQIQSHAVGSVQDNINLGTFENIEFDIPPLPTQRRIADILSALDEKIELNRQVNATLEAMAQAIFREWFVDFNFPDVPDPKGLSRDHAPLQAKESGENGSRQAGETFRVSGIPQGWRMGKLGEICDITMGQSPPGESYNEDGNGVPFFQGRADFDFRFPTRRVFTTDPKRYAKKFDTLVSVRAPVGDMNIAAEDCCIGRGLAAVIHKKRHSSFTYYFLKELTINFKGFEDNGTVFGSINKTEFESMKCVIPDENIIAAFEKICRPIDDTIYNNEQQTATLAALRDALLPKLMSGEIEV